MSSSTTDMKASLYALLQRAQDELRGVEDTLAQRPDMGLGQGSPRAYSWEMALARKERVLEHIDRLRSALERVEEGTYGPCERCGKAIHPERLLAVPTATLCVVCARAASASRAPQRGEMASLRSG